MIPPWITHPNIWKTKSSFMSYLRGGIRRSLWNRSPIKLEFIKANRKRIPNPNPRGKVKEVWGATCALCGKDFPLNVMQIDHVVGNHSLNDLDDLQTFIENIVCVSFDSLQFVDKECHKIKSHADKSGISFFHASCEKEAISLQKSKKDVQWLSERDIVPASNAVKRRKQIIEVLKSEGES